MGRPFDGRVMRAVEARRVGGIEDGLVVEELRSGFVRGDDVLRFADVAVNRSHGQELTAMAGGANDGDTIIGIDLGTTNSEVAIIEGGEPTIVRERGEAILPSCVGLDDAGTVIVGQQARNQAAAAPNGRCCRSSA